MFFKDVIGQKELKRKLIAGVNESRVAHTQLFLGPEGCGHFAMALAYAQFINCENKQVNDSCGQCSSCMKAQKMIHPDIHFSYPVFKSKSDRPALSSDFITEWREAMINHPYQNATQWLEFINSENKQGNISSDECREIIRKLNFKTFESNNKILIIWMVEYLQKEGNILLKLFEEPPDKTIILLIAENRDQILNTVISRSQIVSIPPIDNQSLLEALMQKQERSREEATRITRNAGGNYNVAIHAIDGVENNMTSLFNRWMQLLYKQDATELLEWIDELAKEGREKQKNFFRYGLEFIRECIILQQIGKDFSGLHEEEMKLGIWLTQRMFSDDWLHLSNQLNEAHYHVERNAHPKMLLMNLSVSLQNLILQKKLPLAG